MAKDVVAKQSNLPAHLQEAVQSADAEKEFSGGVATGFPILGYRGKTWRVRQAGEEQVYRDEEGDAIQSINLVLIRSNSHLSKTYYKGKYVEGSNAKPDCWSANGIRPDANVPEPVNATCKACPMNAWGSRVSDEGKQQKACADVRRMAVIMDHELERVVEDGADLDDANVLLLRVPAGSLNPLKEYVEKKLKPKGGLQPYMLVTRVGFDSDASFPKFTFKAARFLDEEEFSTVTDLRETDIVKRIVNESAELDDGESTEDEGEVAGTVHAGKAEASESASPESSEEEYSSPLDDDDDEDIAPPPPRKKAAKKRAAALEEESLEDDDEDEEIAPPPPKKKAAKKKAKKTAKKSPPPEEVESPDESDDEVDDLLDSILG
jgi:hypothetical protein